MEYNSYGDYKLTPRDKPCIRDFKGPYFWNRTPKLIYSGQNSWWLYTSEEGMTRPHCAETQPFYHYACLSQQEVLHPDSERTAPIWLYESQLSMEYYSAPVSRSPDWLKGVMEAREIPNPPEDEWRWEAKREEFIVGPYYEHWAIPFDYEVDWFSKTIAGVTRRRCRKTTSTASIATRNASTSAGRIPGTGCQH